MGTLVRIKLYARGRGAGASGVSRGIRPHRAARRRALRLPAGQRIESHLPRSGGPSRAGQRRSFRSGRRRRSVSRAKRMARSISLPARSPIFGAKRASGNACRTPKPSKPLASAAAIASCISTPPAVPSSSIRRACSSTSAALPKAMRPTRRSRRSRNSGSAARWSRPAAIWRSAMRRQDEPGWKIGVDALKQSAVAHLCGGLHFGQLGTASGRRRQALFAHHRPEYRHGTDVGHKRHGHCEARNRCRRRATAVSVLGRDRGLAFIRRRPDLAALIVTKDNSGNYECVESPRFPRNRDRRGCDSPQR